MFDKLKKIYKDNKDNIDIIQEKIKDINIKQIYKNHKNEIEFKKKTLIKVFDDINLYDGNLEQKLKQSINNLLFNNLNKDDVDIDIYFINDIILYSEDKENIINELENYLTKKDIYLLKKVYVTDEYEELKNLSFSFLNEMDKMKTKFQTQLKLNNFNVNVLYDLFCFMEYYLNNVSNERDLAFIYSLKEYSKQKQYFPVFFNIINAYQNKDFINNILDEYKIFPEDILNIFLEEDIIERKSRFYLLKEYCDDIIKYKNEKLIDINDFK